MDGNLIATENVQTTKCEWCYWCSQLLARAGGDIEGVEATCLNKDSNYNGKYVNTDFTCDAYEPSNGLFVDL